MIFRLLCHCERLQGVKHDTNLFISFILAIFFFSTLSVVGYAQDLSFEASVNINKVSLGETVQLTLTSNDAKPDQPPEIPSVDGMEARYLGPSTNITIINGQYSSRTSHIYTLFFQKTGKFRIPAINVQLKGKTFTSEPIDIEVVDSNASVPGASANDQGASSTGTSIKDRIFLTIEVPRKEFYENEKIPLTIKLYINGLAAQDIQYPQFNHEGFSTEDFGQPKQYEQIVGGVRYQVVEFDGIVYPIRPGDLKLGPATLVCNLVFRNNDQRRPPASDFDHFFDDDFLNGFFNSYQKRAMTLTSVDLPIKVLALPTEGRPEDFSKAVGRFSFEASSSPVEVSVGDPVTLKMSVAGEGNLQAVTLPSLKADERFKTYDPQIKEENGKKILEQVVIPKTDQVSEIPALRFSYFDPQTKTYQKIVQGPFPLKVKKAEGKDEFKIVGFDQSKNKLPSQNETGPAPAPKRPEEIGSDILFIKEQPGNFYSLSARLYKNSFFIFSWILLLFIWVALAFFYNWKKKIQSDAGYARRLYAPKKARRGIEVAQNFLKEDQQKEFYDTIHKTLQEYLADKFHLPPAGVTLEAIEKEFQKRRLEGGVLEKVKTVFNQCDMVRYASLKIDIGQMTETFQQLREVIDYFERHLK